MKLLQIVTNIMVAAGLLVRVRQCTVIRRLGCRRRDREWRRDQDGSCCDGVRYLAATV